MQVMDSLQTAVMVIISVMVLTANMKQLYALLSQKDYPTSNPVIRCLLINLCVADFLVGLLITVPAVLTTISDETSLRDYCDTLGAAIGLCAVSMLFMMSVCIAMYLYTTTQTRRTDWSSSVTPTAWSACNWLIVFVYIGYGFVRFDNIYHYDDLRQICTIRWGYSPFFSVAGLAIFIVVPTVGIAISLHAIRTRMKNFSVTTSSCLNIINHARVVLTVHMLIWGPTVLDIGYTAVYGVPPPRLLAWVPPWLAFLNSFLNVIIYGKLAHFHGNMSDPKQY